MMIQARLAPTLALLLLALLSFRVAGQEPDPVQDGGNPSECRDNNENCDLWAKAGECEKNLAWMKDNCGGSCGHCQGVANKTNGPTQTPPPIEDCRNRQNSSNCNEWTRAGECETNPSWMKEHCGESCGHCQGVVNKTTGPTQTPPPIYIEACEDQYANCSKWAADRECSQNPTWMKQNCPLSCKVCLQHDNTSTTTTLNLPPTPTMPTMSTMVNATKTNTSVPIENGDGKGNKVGPTTALRPEEETTNPKSSSNTPCIQHITFYAANMIVFITRFSF